VLAVAATGYADAGREAGVPLVHPAAVAATVMAAAAAAPRRAFLQSLISL